MPVIPYPEFDKYKPQGFKGVFVGGCVEQGDGSSFRAKAHAHNDPKYPYFGWICVRSAKRLYTRPGQPSNLMWHELCHILAPGHSHDDTWRQKAREQGVYIGKRYRKKRRNLMTVVEKKEDILVNMQAVITDPDAKPIGPAKDGGQWFKNPKTGALYRVDKSGDGYEVKETKQVSQTSARKAKVGGPSRKEMMEEAKAKKIKYFRILSKSELIQVLTKETTPDKLAAIQKDAIKRWRKTSK
jgi:hypothetical protein